MASDRYKFMIAIRNLTRMADAVISLWKLGPNSGREIFRRPIKNARRPLHDLPLGVFFLSPEVTAWI
jgi:hypothetical protein